MRMDNASVALPCVCRTLRDLKILNSLARRSICNHILRGQVLAPHYPPPSRTRLGCGATHSLYLRVTEVFAGFSADLEHPHGGPA